MERSRTEPGLRLRAHVAVHYLTNFVDLDDGVALNHDVGRLLERLVDRVDHVTLLAYEPPEHLTAEDATPFALRPRPANLSIVSLGPKGTWREYPGRRARVRRIVRKLSPAWDLLLLRLVNRRAHLVWKASQCPRLVAHVGGSMLGFRLGERVSVRDRLLGLPSALWEELQQRRIIGAAGLTLTVGEDLLDRYAGASPNIHILRHSALRDGDMYAVDDRLTDARPRFGFVGQMIAPKGIFDAIEAFSRIRSRHPDAHLDVIGRGEAEAAVRARVNELALDKAVTFHGWIGDRDDLLALYRQLDVLFCLSHVDFLPRVVWEAFASSVPVIATRVGALPRAFRDREELLFVPVGDVEAVVDAVETLVRTPALRRALIARARDRAREATIDRMMDGMIEGICRTWPELCSKTVGTS